MDSHRAVGPEPGVRVNSSGDLIHEAEQTKPVTLNVHMPERHVRPKANRGGVNSDKVTTDVLKTGIPTMEYEPSEMIQNLLNSVTDDAHAPHDVFCQMDVLANYMNELEWREYGRWVKYEEIVDEGGDRWSKPHVASLSMSALFALRNSICNGVVLLDLDVTTIAQLADKVVDDLIAKDQLSRDQRDELHNAITRTHKHQNMKRRYAANQNQKEDPKKRPARGSGVFTLERMDSRLELSSSGSVSSFENHKNSEADHSEKARKGNKYFMRKIPDGAEVVNIMVGEVDFLQKRISAFIRLTEPRDLGGLSEVTLPTRFVYILIGPKSIFNVMSETGRSVGTMMVDEVFHEVAYKSRARDDLLVGIDEFMNQVTVLPPGNWDPTIRIDPPTKVPPTLTKRMSSFALLNTAAIATQPTDVKDPLPHEDEEEEEDSHMDPTLVRTGRLFGGLIEDIKRKAPWYLSDYTDCLHIQCVASVVFLYLATFTQNVTFGGLLGQATNQLMGTMECIFAAAITGVVFTMFSGQPLNIIGSTGPMLVLEMILYQFSIESGIDFLPFRCWIGFWTAFIILIVVAFDLSSLVRYITRFTEESFACLIALIFIYEAFHKVIEIGDHQAPVNYHPDQHVNVTCACAMAETANGTSVMNLSAIRTTSAMSTAAPNVTNLSNITDMFNQTLNLGLFDETMCENYSDTVWSCDGHQYVADVYFLSLLLFIGTFVISMALVAFRNSPFFPTIVRQTVSDFAVMIAILCMAGTDAALGLGTPKLEVPAEFKPTNSELRGWFINPISDINPWWTYLAACLPAFLSSILIFMDQQITSVIVNRKENKLKKGGGYHLDMLIVMILIIVCSLLGLPWFVAATVSAIAHIMSLRKESDCNAPGEKPVFLGVREQRVTGILIGLLSGLSVLFTSVLRYIPMAVLYGVFLYMGVSALKGMQLMDRIMIMFMPPKYQPDLIYLRHVKVWRIHMFTFIQVFCLACLWVVKSVQIVSIVFPLMVLATIFFRKAMDCFYSQYELKWLDDLMPGVKKDKKGDLEQLTNGKVKKTADILEKYTKVDIGNGHSEKKTSFFVGDETHEAYDNKAYNDSKL